MDSKKLNYIKKKYYPATAKQIEARSNNWKLMQVACIRSKIKFLSLYLFPNEIGDIDFILDQVEQRIRRPL